MCQIAMIILATMGLCGTISTKGLSIGVLIGVGIQIFCEILKEIIEEK